jgi:hydrogenase 3 maturation protease
MNNKRSIDHKTESGSPATSDFDALAISLKSAKRIAILGIGSELMQDDNAGIEVSLSLEKKFGTNHPLIRVFTAYTTPENFTKDIADFNPDHLVIVDAADLKLQAGEVAILPVERITDFSLGTHKLSLVMMITFLKETINPTFSVLVIQYKSIILGEKMTSEVKKGVKKTTAFLTKVIEQMQA